MSDSVLLSLTLGAPLAILAIVLLFRIEMNQVTDRSTSSLTRVSTVVVTLAVVGLAISRFVFMS